MGERGLEKLDSCARYTDAACIQHDPRNTGIVLFCVPIFCINQSRIPARSSKHSDIQHAS